MTMNSSNSGGMSSEINVTPMIDVLLVLLIIFMVIVPVMPRGEAAQALHQSRSDVQIADAVVLEVLQGTDGQATVFKINQQTVARQELPVRLAEIYAKRAQRVLFVVGRTSGVTFPAGSRSTIFLSWFRILPPAASCQEIPGARSKGTT
ncbi:MAG: biopolymer transporter ExbD [Terracidiphilus sp.]